MEISKTFDAYDVIGVIVPGSVITGMLALQWSPFLSLLGQDGISIGGLGVFVFASFVFGHLAQAGGNALEKLMWILPGMPTDWVRKDPSPLISTDQLAQLQTRVSVMEPGAGTLSQIGKRQWRQIVTRIDARVRDGGRAGRVDVFNRTYGLFRGLSTAFLVCGIWYCLDSRGLPIEAMAALALSAVAAVRMWRYGVHYARCLFLAFIELPLSREDAEKVQGDGPLS
ncbi:MAG: hypothetical protein C0456_17030 [Hyphomonas sp.]|uniref:hypothetical protein n=1 Tax=Hyphomonas sp. TaxID=87 RepID=UPI001DD15EDB|nr:hypothetical protein [Hyphomonas sp.]MBA4228318.1 hypothetical protein [Hyphomonas sp.]